MYCNFFALNVFVVYLYLYFCGPVSRFYLRMLTFSHKVICFIEFLLGFCFCSLFLVFNQFFCSYQVFLDSYICFPFNYFWLFSIFASVYENLSVFLHFLHFPEHIPRALSFCLGLIAISPHDLVAHDLCSCNSSPFWTARHLLSDLQGIHPAWLPLAAIWGIYTQVTVIVIDILQKLRTWLCMGPNYHHHYSN